MIVPKIVFKKTLNENIATIKIKKIYVSDVFHPDIFFAVQNHETKYQPPTIYYDFVIYLYDDPTNPYTDDYLFVIELLDRINNPPFDREVVIIGNNSCKRKMKIADIEIPTFYPTVYPLKYKDYANLPWEE